METDQTLLPPYLPFATFLTGLDHLAAISIPNEIEARTFTSMNPHNKAQMISALKFFGLISKDNKPQPLLSELAHKKDQRKDMVRSLIESHYSDIAAFDFAKMTPTQLENALSSKKYNVAGDTKKKAKAFLLKAAQFAGYTIHPLLTKITRARRKGAGKQATVSNGKASQADEGNDGGAASETPVHRTHKSHTSEKTVHLKGGGGSVTLSLDVNILEMDEGEDRDFVLALTDRLRAYEKGLKVSADEKDKVEKEAGE